MEGSSSASSKSAKLPHNNKRGNESSRAERKRVQDRLAQRATRERTKSRIAFLEQRLKSLEAQDRQGEIVSLTRIIDDLRNENHRLRDALLKMRSTIDETITATSGNCSSTSPVFEGATLTTATTNTAPIDHLLRRHSSMSTDAASEVVVELAAMGGNSNHDYSSSHQQRCHPPHPEGEGGGAASLVVEDDEEERFDTSTFEFSPDTLLQMFEAATPIHNLNNTSSSSSSWGPTSSSSLFDFRIPTPEIVNIAPDVDKWHVSNGAFINALTEVKNRNPSDQELDLHVPFKAAIWGWNNVGPEAQHPVWLALRQVDQRVFGTWKSKAQRIALMYVCQTLMQYRENPTQENLARVPEFLRPRPSQEKIQHPAVIDFLIWPALRDRLVFEYQKYTSTGAFSKAFVENFNFYWPYPDRDIFVYDPASDGYEISPMFLRHAYEIKNWTMRPAFFKQFPEMQHDIPLFPETTGDVSGDTWTI